MGLLKDLKSFLFPPIIKKTNKEIENEKKEYRAKYLDQARLDIPTKDETFVPDMKWKDIDIRVIDVSPNVYLVNKGARLSVGMTELDSYENRLKHIGKCVTRGHESILEHSNIISLIRIPKNTLCMLGYPTIFSLIEVIAHCKYLNVKTTNVDDYLNILIGGSIRGYLDCVRETNELNIMIFLIKRILEQSCEKEFLVGLINQKLIDENQCNYKYTAELKYEHKIVNGEESLDAIANIIEDPKTINGDLVDLIYCQDSLAVYNQVSEYGFSLKDVRGLCIVSFLFHNISRAIGNQLVRHRVGITQESQRYCEHSTDKMKDFVDPILLHLKDKTGRYDNLDPRVEVEYLKRKNPFTTYKYLISQGVKKEDARAWLPMNVTTKIMMTFTQKQYAKFLQLRLDKAAQYEIQKCAQESLDLLTKNCILNLGWKNKESINEFISFNTEWDSITLREELENGESSDLGLKDIKKSVQKVEVDEEDNNISTEVISTTAEDIQSLDINTLDDAEKYLRESEEMKNL